MAKAKTVEEKLAIANAKAEMFQAEVNRLGLAEYDARQKLEIESVKSKAKIADLTADNMALDAKLKLEVEETNRLRCQLFDLHLTQARLNGYLDGIEDAKPPVMVPQERPLRRMTTGDQDISYVDGGPYEYRGQRPKPWFFK